MLQGVPTLYPNGVSNAAPGSFGAGVPMLWPPQYYSFFDDFDTYKAGAGLDWLATVVGTTPTAVVDDALGGQLLITNAATDDSSYSAQWLGGQATVVEAFQFVPGKELWFAARFQISDAVQSDLLIGLAITDTTPLDASDGVFFLKNDGSAVLTLVEKIATPLTATANLGLTLANATWYEIGFHYNGFDTVRAFSRDSGLASWSSIGSVGVSALPTTELTPTFHFQNGEAVAKTARIDYIFAAQER